MIIAACVFLVTADIHSYAFSPELVGTMGSYEDNVSMVIAGDFVDHSDQWDRTWTQPLRDLDFWGVPGNHDDEYGFSRNSGMRRGICGDEDEPSFIFFGLDSFYVLSRGSTSGLAWAEENYPYTPWVVFTHDPLVSCIGHDGMSANRVGRRLLSSMPDDSIVVSGHEHVFCLRHMEGWTQIITSTGGGKKYECRGSLPGGDICEELPDYPTFVRLDPTQDDLTFVGVMEDGLSERHMSILEGEAPWDW